jgi:uncharacterized membrane protein
MRQMNQGAAASATTPEERPEADRNPHAGDEGLEHRRILWALVVLVGTVLFLRPIASSLWLDELGTWWVVKDGVRDVVSRSWQIQGQSPLFYLMAWATRWVTGPTEWALRIPSLACTLMAAALLYRLARRVLDREYGRLTVLVFVVWPSVAFAAVDFRPYALATLLTVLTVVAYLDWMDRWDPRWATVFVLAAAATIYVHYAFGLIVVALAAYSVWRRRSGLTTPPVSWLIGTFASVAFLCVPLVAQVVDLWGRRGQWTQGFPLSVDWVAAVTAPSFIVLGAGVGCVVAAATGNLYLRRVTAPAGFVPLLVFWIAVPLSVLILVTLFTNADLAIARYALVFAPGAVLAIALLLRSVQPDTGRRLIALCVGIGAIVALARMHHAADWRGSVTAANAVADERSLVIVQPGFTESGQDSWLQDPERRSFLLAPLTLYPVEGNVVLLPRQLDPVSEQQLRHQIQDGAVSASNVVLINGGILDTWVEEVLGPDAWSERPVPTADEPSVVEFTRNGSG